MEGECKVQLDATTEAKKQSTFGSKLTALLLTFTLCVVCTLAVVFNTQAKSQGQDGDIHHALRQIQANSNVRAAIHLEGVYNPEIKTSVEWKNQVDQSHSQGGLELDNNEIVVRQKGLYFVYSQASFRVNCTSGGDDGDVTEPSVHVSHAVERWSSSYGDDDANKSYKTIMHSIRSACELKASSDGDEERWFTAIYMGAVFNLKRGDRLRTQMEERMLLDLEDEPGKTFFGVFAL